MPEDVVKVDDLVDLWGAGAVHLPTVAVQYAELARQLHRTALSEEPAFRRSIGGRGRQYAAWTDLRNLMQDEVAVRSHTNLLKAGKALMEIADSYATTDHLNADQIAEYEQRIENIERGVTDTGKDLRPPPYVPDAPGSSDPHPEHSPTPGRGF